MSWTYTSNDPGLALFTSAYKANSDLMPVNPGDHLLDVGCNEADWVTLAHEAWPEAYVGGIDWRAKDWTSPDGHAWKRQKNGLDPLGFAPHSSDAIISLSAIEHFGLGHYANDPKDPDGDTHMLANCWRWLKPGGWLYFDVPYDPRKYWVAGTSHRAYDDAAVWTRLWQEPLAQAKATARWHWTGYVHMKHCDQLIEKPTTQPDDQLHYYIACLWQKVG
jgi:SAM-dependent methyltransferase